ncbi:MAG TPA: TonB-dependent receptor [Terracidiphilus sp.]|nr:TonB-dependent receptor [Terracidiphilus sp.]
MKSSIASARKRVSILGLSVLVLLVSALLPAQQTGSKLEGTIVDVQGKAVSKAQVAVKNEATGAVRTTYSDATGFYSINGLSAGNYTVEATAAGFAPLTKTGVALAAGQASQVALKLTVSSVAEQVTVNAGIDSIAAETAPSGGFIEERSAQSLVSNTYIENFTSPIADFGEIVQIVPGTFTTSANGIGLGQSKTYFRGFQDGDYNIDFDGIPFYDTNSPTHHSWAFFPSQWVGGVDFDRSPGTASTIGPTPFGGSIHLLSKPLSNEQDIRGTVSYGTWNTKLYDGAFNSGSFGLFGGPKKSNLFVDVHHMTSDGYQSFNYNLRNAGSLLYQYQFSPKTVLTGFAGIVQLNSNGPNISSTRCMLYGVSATSAYSCASPTVTVAGTPVPVTANGLLPYTGAGLKFLLTDNSDPVSWFDNQYNRYQVPTDFEYVSLKSDFAKGWYFEVKPYTYNYDNGELYSNATPMTEVTNAAAAADPSLVPGAVVVGGKAYYDGVSIAPCDVQVVKKGIAALPCAIDKYNSYRKYGETALVTQTSRFGVLRAGMWYEWADTNRHQYPSDPLNNWADQPLPKFSEQFWTNSYQPFGEYEFHVTPQFNVTAGVKFAAYSIDVLHQADDGATVGPLTCASNTATCSATVSNSGSFTAWLPSLDANYRILPNWSVYVQGATGSIVPPSSVYDYNQTAASASAAVPQLVTPPKQQKSTTIQAGTVYKGQRLTLDADFYRIRFQNSYSSAIDNIAGDVDQGDTIYYLQPSSITQGVEFEATAVLAHGLTLYLNSTADNAYYSGKLNAGTQAAPYLEQAPGGLWVASTPTDTEQQGLTYQSHDLDLGIFNHRVGEERVDNGQYHNQAIIAPFSTLNTYVNYTVRNHSIFDGTKIRLDATNLLDSHNIQSLSLAGAAQTLTIPGATVTDQFNTSGPTPINGADTPGIMAGRTFSVTVTFGFAPRER